jgi:O-antigen/teichoic acid export membrane protein
MKNNNLLKNLFLKTFESFLVQFFSLLGSIFLARLIFPNEYGIYTIAVYTITLILVFINYGFGTALIQFSSAKNIHYSSVFIFIQLIGLILMLFTFLISPLIENYFNYIGLANILRLMSLAIIPSSLLVVPQAKLIKESNFFYIFISTLISTILSILIAIILAINNFGVYSLVWQYISNLSFLLFFEFLFSGFVFQPKFNLNQIKPIINFSWKIMIVGLIDTIFNEISGFIIGKNYSIESLAYYNRGFQLPKMVLLNLNASVDSVLFPKLSIFQFDFLEIKKIFSEYIELSLFFMFPASFLFLVSGNELISLLFSDLWLSSVPFLYWGTIFYFLTPFYSSVIQVLKAIGKAKTVLFLNLIKITLSLLFILIGVNFGIYYLPFALIIALIISIIINFSIIKKTIKITIKEIFNVIFPLFFISILTTFVFILIKQLISNHILLIILQIGIGGIVYLVSGLLFRIRVFKNIASFIFISKV